MPEKRQIPARTLSLPSALERGIRELEALTDRDAALVQLARRYVVDLEEGAETWRVGPRLLDCLRELGMTPAARARTMPSKAPEAAPETPAGGEPVVSPADQLAQRRRNARERRAATLDASAT